MNLKIDREVLSVSEKIYDGIQEQNVELDYILPDYCPDIFKLIRCSVLPVVTSCTVNGDTLNYELSADVKILYCSEGDARVQCINQRLLYSKSVNLGDSPANPDISVTPKSEHINCRVVNKRRIDMRGAVSIKITVNSEAKQEAIKDISGMNLQAQKISAEYMAKRQSVRKVLTVNDEITLNSANPSVGDIIRTQVNISEPESKVISNKIVVKGEAAVKALYTVKDSMDTLTFTVPYSQIVDMEGIDESYGCYVTSQGVSCDITPTPDENGDNRLLKYELKLYVKCVAYKTMPVQLVSDAYSTAYPCEYATAELAVEQQPVMINDKFFDSMELDNGENTISHVYDLWCSAKNINVTTDNDNKTIKLSGMLCYQAMVKNDNNAPSVLEKDQAFEKEIPCDMLTQGSTLDIDLSQIDCTYNLTDTNGISVKAEITVKGELYTCSAIKAVTDLTIDDSAKITRDGDYALKLYYGVKDEQIWDIAKKYSTSVNAIMEENALENESLTQDGMLLIPIV